MSWGLFAAISWGFTVVSIGLACTHGICLVLGELIACVVLVGFNMSALVSDTLEVSLSIYYAPWLRRGERDLNVGVTLRT